MELNNHADTFLVGSDQMFNSYLYNNFGKWVTLDWVNDNKKKVAYAASFGHDTFLGSENERAEMSHFMKKFDKFSVREESGVKLAKDEFGVEAVQVLDPVFLCDPNVFKEIAKNAKINLPKKFVSCYILDPNKEKENLLTKVSKKLHLPLSIFTEMFETNESIKNRWSLQIEIGKVEDRLLSLINSDFIVTDSFHGTCFAIIFKKNFIAINNKDRGTARFVSLLSKLGLMDRLISSCDEIAEKPDLFKDIDYDAVYKILNSEIQKDKNWLNDALEIKTKKEFSTYDILNKKLFDENQKLRNQINYLSRMLEVEYAFEYDIFRFIGTLNKRKNNLLIIISSKDTPGMSINDDLSKRLQSLGIKTDLKNKHWCGYYAVIYKGIVISENCKYEKKLNYKTMVENIEIDILSAPLHAGNLSSIKINNIEYSKNGRGLNFVIFDLDKNQISDSVAFDTHTPKFIATR